jgi:tryptophan synthase alpha chain
LADHSISGTRRIDRALEAARREGRPALVPFLTAGFPRRDGFPALMERVAGEGDLLEIGVPFSDPMADGTTVQRASRIALEGGVTLSWILEMLERTELPIPVVLMSYLNPLLAYGLQRLARSAAKAGIDGFIVPDLPWEESLPLREALSPFGLGLVQMVTPATPAPRLRLLGHGEGFLYAVTVTGVTGGSIDASPELAAYLARVRSSTSLPVLAGFGIRSVGQLRSLRSHTDGVVIGSALLEAIERGEDPAAFLRVLRAFAGVAVP